MALPLLVRAVQEQDGADEVDGDGGQPGRERVAQLLVQRELLEGRQAAAAEPLRPGRSEETPIGEPPVEVSRQLEVMRPHVHRQEAGALPAGRQHRSERLADLGADAVHRRRRLEVHWP